MDKSNMIEKYISLIGNNCKITYGSDVEVNTKCVLNQLWKKNKTVFEPDHSKVGLVSEDYYMLILPKSCDSRCFHEKAVLSIHDKNYYFIKYEPIYVSGILQYHYCIVKELFEEDQNVFE